MHVLIVRQNGVGLRPKEIVVPNTKNAKRGGQVLLQGSIQEVLVHGVAAFQQLLEPIKPDVQGNRQANGAPERITPTDPIPESKHVARIDSKFSDFSGVC